MFCLDLTFFNASDYMVQVYCTDLLLQIRNIARDETNV